MSDKAPWKISERALVTELEACNTKHVNEFFSGKFEEERIQAVNRLRDIYLDDVKKGVVPKDQMQFEARQWFGAGISILGSKPSDLGHTVLYSDKFEPGNGYQHSNPADKWPPSRKEFDPALLRKLTTELEKGDISGLQPALKGLYLEEQMRVMQSMIDLNRKDVAAKQTNAILWSDNPHNTKSSYFGIQLLRAPDNGMFTSTSHVYTYSVDGVTGVGKNSVSQY